MINRHSLRLQIRARRQALSQLEQKQAAKALMQQVVSCPQLMQHQHFALYLANDAELDTTPLIQALWQAGKSVYLPVLHPLVSGYLLFLPYQPDTRLVANRFGIAEPPLHCQQLQLLTGLDVIFTPLVAFDQQGNRLGMGGGFYDRTLSQLPANSSTEIVGLAHNCQQVDNIPAEAWDIPLKHIITPAHRFIL